MAQSKLTDLWGPQRDRSPERNRSPIPQRDRSPVNRTAAVSTKGSAVRTRSFPKSWLVEFPWIQYDETDNAMFCKDCKLFGTVGSWSTGNSNFRIKTVREHASSEAHKTAVAGSQPGQSTITVQVQKDSEARKRAIITALEAAYFVATEELPNIKYGSLIKFLQRLDVKDAKYLNRGKNAQYTSPDVFNQLLECLSTVLEKQLKQEIKQSPVIGIGTDESTDRAQEKHVAIIIRYIAKNGSVTTNFLALEKIKDGTAMSNFDSLAKVLDKYDVPWKKVVGLGADGASVMSGERTGLRRLVEDVNPYCTYVHCVCHRLNLAVSQACKSVPEMETVGKMLSAIFNYIHQSPKKHQEFKDIAELLDTDTLKFKKVFEVRWLSMGNSVLAVLRNYEPLTVFLSKEADAGEPVAIGLLQQLTSYLYLALLHLSADILSTTNHLSKLFQFRDVSFAAIRGSLQDCQQTLTSFRGQPGPHLEKFMLEVGSGDTFMGQQLRMETTGRGQHQPHREKFEQTRQEILTEILDNLDARFPSVALLDAMQIFDPVAYPDNADDLIMWGNNHLATLLDFYGRVKRNRDGVPFNPPVNSDVARGEFLPFKRIYHRNRGDEHGEGLRFYRPLEVFEKLFDARDRHGNRFIFPEMFKLMSICTCVMVGNAEAERVFSCQNRIKSKLRTGLTISHLDQLIRLSYLRIPPNDFQFQHAADLFLTAARRI